MTDDSGQKLATASDSVQPEVLTFHALLTLLGRRSRQSIYDLMRRDPSFPRPRQMGSEFSIGWLRSEVMEWLKALPVTKWNGLDAVERRRQIGRMQVPTLPKSDKPAQATAAPQVDSIELQSAQEAE